MAALRTLLILTGALATLWLGAVGMPMPAEAATPPCHAAVDQHQPAPDHGAPKAMKVMGCCVACVAPALPQPPTSGPASHRVTTPAPALSAALPDRHAAPEPGPPKH